MKLRKTVASLLSVAMLTSLLTPAAQGASILADTGVKVLVDGAAVDVVEMTQNDQPVLTAEYRELPKLARNTMSLTSVSEEETYQWQFLYQPDGTTARDIPEEEQVWIDIYGETEAECTLSYAMVYNMLNEEDEAQIRCEITKDGEAHYSDPKTVEFMSDEQESETPSEEVEVLPAAQRMSRSLNQPLVGANAGISTLEEFQGSEMLPNEEPSEEPTESAEPSEPVETAEPSTEPSEPVETAEPSTEPSEPVESVEPSAEPSEPVETVEPSAEPSEPVETAEPSTEPSEPPVVMHPIEIPEETVPGADEPELETYTITVTYQFTDGTEAASPYILELPAGSSWTERVTSPTVLGYRAEPEFIDISITDLQEDVPYTVTYYPDNVNYTVIYYWQNVDNDEYTEYNRETKTGLTGQQVQEVTAEFAGMVQLPYERPEIAADGSTEVEVYYDRMYYLLNFDLDGGWGVEPIYARYGTEIGDVGTPEKPGYTFRGWLLDGQTVEVPTNMPAENRTLTADWSAGNTSYTIVRWTENANDDNYSFYDSETRFANSGDTVTVLEGQAEQIEHFTFDRADTATVEGDGSTVINVYYTRNTYTLTFVDPNGWSDTPTCGLEEHEHTYEDRKYVFLEGYEYKGGCYPENEWSQYPTCGKQEHTHRDSCYSGKVVKVLTAKYDSDIMDEWPVEGYEEGYVWQSSATEKYYSVLEKMPGQDLTLTATEWSGDRYTWYYYLEVLPGQDTSGLTIRVERGRTYYLYHTVSIRGNSLSLTYEEDYFPIDGFTQRDGDVPDFTNEGGYWAPDYKAYLYYTRNQYDLSFYNVNATVEGRTERLYYEADLSDKYFVPGYPETLEENAYTFEGWYTTPECFADSKFTFEGAKMPNGDLQLYANWVPISHTLKVYQSEEAMNGDAKPVNTQTVAHGAQATEVDEETMTPPAEGLSFVGWFYRDETGAEKAFSFDMPIRQDLNIYAKWGSKDLISYTVRYVTMVDGMEVEIAAPTTGSALYGTTRTFEAKTGNDLYEDYRTGYFPNTNSHSILITLDPEKNTFTFIYEAKDQLPYTVKYLEAGTGEVLHQEKKAESPNAVVTETFVYVPGYMPDAYQKTLVLQTENPVEENVIVFWYTEDSEHAYYQVNHYIQNIAGDGYTLYTSRDEVGTIGTLVEEEPLNLDGFTYNEGKSYPSGTVTAQGLVLDLYYDRIEYPYVVHYQDTEGKQLLPDTEGKGRYQSQVTEHAPTIPGYELVSNSPQSIVIQIEDLAEGQQPVKNVILFQYREQNVTIHYRALEGGSVSPESETIPAATGTAKGSIPTANEGYKFVGWYEDESCTRPVDSSWVDGTTNQLTPQEGSNGVYEAATYYAKFELDSFDLTITKTVNETPKQSFIFDVHKDTAEGEILTTVVLHPDDFQSTTATVTISGVPGGTYVVTERENWSWMYKLQDGNNKTVTMENHTASFTNNRDGDNWLGGTAKAENQFKVVGEVPTPAAMMDALVPASTLPKDPDDDSDQKKDPSHEPEPEEPEETVEEGVSGNEG